ncbi:MAG: AbrB/MazE/SpoVT family DNA-binding domain-containing protein [Candidatus Electrothrix sp. LOE2]|jgi:AbrB family looped-hinge helix DNA binding protein|nr:AbrB/MazE/SpoVT family DNA-binding domain-containing protein [Candidatus Electrothrix sp. LOE2]
MLQTKLSGKFQVSIPKAMRHDLDLRAGQRFILVARGRIIEMIPHLSIKEARGMLSDCEYTDSSEYRDRIERKSE